MKLYEETRKPFNEFVTKFWPTQHGLTLATALLQIDVDGMNDTHVPKRLYCDRDSMEIEFLEHLLAIVTY